MDPRDEFYETYYSVIFIPPGEVPQTKGAWKDCDVMAEMLVEMPKHYPAETQFWAAESRCGEIHVQEASEWLHMLQIGIECAEEEAAYIKAGVCADCGACSQKEAEEKCKPRPLGDTGDYFCAGENLWREEGDA